MLNTLVIQSSSEKKNKIEDQLLRQIALLGSIFRATSIIEGIAAIRDRQPDLVILDVDLPEGSGFRIFEETAEFEYEKIILCEHQGYFIKALRFDVINYIVKPLIPYQLCQSIERMQFARKRYRIQQMYRDRFLRRSFICLDRVLLTGVTGNRFLKVCGIVRIADSGTLRTVFLDDGDTFDTRMSLRQLSAKLACNEFVKVDPRTMVHIRHVIDQGPQADLSRIVLTDGTTYPVSFRTECRIREKCGEMNKHSLLGPSPS